MYHRSILSEHTSTSSKVSRALKSPLPGSIISKASVNEGSVRDGAGEEVETDSLESLVETLFRLYSLSHGIVGRIWGVRTEGRKRIRIGRKYSDIDESELSVAGTGFGNSARQVLRGVKERVKRVGGVGEGFVFPHIARSPKLRKFATLGIARRFTPLPHSSFEVLHGATRIKKR